MRGRRVHVRGGCLDEPEALLPWPGAISRRACAHAGRVIFLARSPYVHRSGASRVAHALVPSPGGSAGGSVAGRWCAGCPTWRIHPPRVSLAGKLDLTRAEAVLAIIEAGSRHELEQRSPSSRAASPGRSSCYGTICSISWLMSKRDLISPTKNSNSSKPANCCSAWAKGWPSWNCCASSSNSGRLAIALSGWPWWVGQTRARVVFSTPWRDVLLRGEFPARDDVRLLTPGSRARWSPPRVLIHTAGWQNRLADASDWCEPTPTRRVSEVDPSLIEEQAQKLGREQAEQADLLLLCIEAGRPEDAQEQQFLTRRGMPAVVAVATKCDLATPSLDRLATAPSPGRASKRYGHFLPNEPAPMGSRPLLRA